jgi:hypothetical protein
MAEFFAVEITAQVTLVQIMDALYNILDKARKEDLCERYVLRLEALAQSARMILESEKPGFR